MDDPDIPVSLHGACVPVFGRYLRQLAAMLALAEQHAAKQRADPQVLLQARLSPTMYPFARQVEIAAGFALRACAPLAGIDTPVPADADDTFAGLQRRVAAALAFVESLTPAQMARSAEHPVSGQAGQATITLPAHVFLLQYALPNFFFHVTTAYAILRHMGVGLGKRDFDGFHVY